LADTNWEYFTWVTQQQQHSPLAAAHKTTGSQCDRPTPPPPTHGIHLHILTACLVPSINNYLSLVNSQVVRREFF
jgi:hypothetical protein